METLKLFPEHILLLFQKVVLESDSILTPAGTHAFLKLIGKCLKEKKWYINEPIADLSKDLGISVNTLRKGIDELVNCGVLLKKKSESRREPISYSWVSPSPSHSPEETVDSSVRHTAELPLESIVETLLYCSSEPLPIERIAYLAESTPDDVLKAISQLREEYSDRPLQIIDNALGYRVVTKPEFKVFASKITQSKPLKLTEAELEVLSIIFYKSPVSIQEIGRIRGKEPTTSLESLIKRKFVEEIKYEESPARYQPTNEAIAHFGMRDLSELPPLNIQF